MLESEKSRHFFTWASLRHLKVIIETSRTKLDVIHGVDKANGINQTAEALPEIINQALRERFSSLIMPLTLSTYASPIKERTGDGRLADANI